jgi:Transglutaminase-like superfamily
MRYISNSILFLRIFVFAATVPYLLRLKLSRVASVLEPGGNSVAVEEDTVRRIAAYTETVIRRGNPLVRRGCLTRGLTRYYFLRRAGMDVALCFGMGRPNGEFMGHCWLVKDGEPFLEVEDPRPLYAEMYCVSPSGGRACGAVEANGFERLVNS